jgi:hypothetical protein
MSDDAAFNDSFWATMTATVVATTPSEQGYGVPSFSFNVPFILNAFTPNSISNLIVWTDPTDPITNGATNRVASGFTTTSTASLRTGVLNGKNVLGFNTSQFWRIDGTPNIANYTMFSVSRYTAGQNRRILSGGDAVNQLFGYWQRNERVLYIDNNPGILAGLGADLVWDRFSHSRFTGGAYVFNWNGVSTFTGGTSSVTPLHALQINASNENSDCEMAEFLLYNRVLSSGEIAQVDAYLVSKWGL